MEFPNVRFSFKISSEPSKIYINYLDVGKVNGPDSQILEDVYVKETNCMEFQGLLSINSESFLSVKILKEN